MSKNQTIVKFLLIAPVPSLALGLGTVLGSPLTGNVPSTNLQSETPAANVMIGTISASAAADDNNNNSGSQPIGGAQYHLAPSLALQQWRSHLRFNSAYTPGLRFYVPSSSQPDRFCQS